MSENMLEIKSIKKTFNPGTVNEKIALEDVSLTLKKGDFATIIGSNGAGNNQQRYSGSSTISGRIQ